MAGLRRPETDQDAENKKEKGHSLNQMHVTQMRELVGERRDLREGDNAVEWPGLYVL